MNIKIDFVISTFLDFKPTAESKYCVMAYPRKLQINSFIKYAIEFFYCNEIGSKVFNFSLLQSDNNECVSYLNSM
jgi:hypothetical protein